MGSMSRCRGSWSPPPYSKVVGRDVHLPLCLGAAVPAGEMDFSIMVLQEKCHGNSKLVPLGRM